MAERFTKLQVFPENLYTENAPIIITAGNLLKDNQLSRVLAQLKIKNIDKRTVDEITLQFRLIDANGKILKDAYEHKIEHTRIVENDYYGSKNPITIPDGNVKSCEIKVTQVWFADGTVWNSRSEWVPLAPSTDLDDLKAKRDSKLSKEEKERQVKELEEKRIADEEKAQTRRKIKKIAIILGAVVLLVACIMAGLSIHTKHKTGPVIEALAGTSWEHYDDVWKFAESYITEEDTSENTYNYIDWEVIGVKNNTMEISVEGYRVTFEIIFAEENGKYTIETIRNQKYGSTEYTYLERID